MAPAALAKRSSKPIAAAFSGVLQQLRANWKPSAASAAQQRQRRESVPVPTVALVGYTNAGKSTLFNAITRAGVLESSRMFATLDPKLSAIQLPSRRKILLSDTVGFIRDLPHTLVTSFRATLEEVRKAEILIHVRDASSPMRDEHKAEVEKVLGELAVLDKPRLEVLNKIDLLGEEERAALVKLNARAIATSAKERIGLDTLMQRIDEELVQDPILEQRLQIPQSEGDALAALEAGAVIRDREYQGNMVQMTVAGPASLLGRYRRFRLPVRKSTRKSKPDDGEWWVSPITRFADPDPGRGGILIIRRYPVRSSCKRQFLARRSHLIYAGAEPEEGTQT